MPGPFFGETRSLALPQGTIVEFAANGPLRENDSSGIARVERPILTRYVGYSYVCDAPLPPDTVVLHLAPTTERGLAELGKRPEDQDYELQMREKRLATQGALANLSILQLFEGGEPNPEIVQEVGLTVHTSESTLDIMEAVEHYMATQKTQRGGIGV